MRPNLFPLLGFILLMSDCRKEERQKEFWASGTFEATEVRVSPTVSGQVLEVWVEEGVKIEAGAVVARIDDRHLRNQIEQAEALLALADAQVRIVRLGARKEDIAALREQLRQAEEAYEQARKDRDRALALVKEEGLPRKTLEDAETLVAVRQAQVRAAKEVLKKAQKGARPEEIEAAEAQKRQALAALKALKDRMSDYVVRSPISGVVTKKFVEPGEVVAAGQPIATVADLRKMTLRVYVPERHLGHVRLGQRVKVLVDAFPERPFHGKVAYIASEAEFTPRNVQTYEERVKTVYAVKIEVANPEGLLKIGMPADAVFDLSLEEGGGEGEGSGGPEIKEGP